MDSSRTEITGVCGVHGVNGVEVALHRGRSGAVEGNPGGLVAVKAAHRQISS